MEDLRNTRLAPAGRQPAAAPIMNPDPLRIGAIGAGGFGLFALQQFLQVPGVQLMGIAGTHREAALAMAKRFGVPDVVDTDALLAGKHVLCEKPLAMTVAQADELLALARSRNLLCIANLMQRYNPLFDAVSRLVESRVLGDCL